MLKSGYNQWYGTKNDTGSFYTSGHYLRIGRVNEIT